MKPSGFFSAYLRSDRLWIILLGALLFIPYLGGVHLFDWDEINFAECAREMLVSGKFLQVQIGFEPFWEKPPLFFWLQAASMSLFGVDAFAARLPNALAGIVTLLLVYDLGLRLRDRLFARLWVLAWLGSVLPHFYFRSGIIDPWFNFWIFSSLWVYFRSQQMPGYVGGVLGRLSPNAQAIVGGVLLGLAVLTKGPVAGLIAGLTLTVYVLYWKGRRPCLSIPRTAVFGVAAVLVSASWFLVDIALHGFWLTTEFIKYQYRLFSTPDAGHGGFPGYHLVVLLLGCFPASVFALSAFRHNKDRSAAGCSINSGGRRMEVLSEDDKFFLTEDFRRWMLALFWVVLVLFSMVKSKIVHYSSLAYFPITFLAAYVLHGYLRSRKALPLWQTVLLSVLAVFIFGGAVLLPYAGMHMDWFLAGFSPSDLFAVEAMQAVVAWNWWDYLPALLFGVLVFAGIVWARRARWRAALIALFGGTALFVQLGLYFFAGKIEHYSQRAAIEFCESKAGKQVYLAPLYYKSYAHWFYGRVPEDWPAEAKDPSYLLRGPLDRDAFFIVKADHLQLAKREHPDLELLYRKNGFAFFRRRAHPEHHSEPESD